MGATTFCDRAEGPTARDAFIRARDTARLEFGFGGYTGTIAEKETFVLIPLPQGLDPEDYAEILLEKDDARVSDKYGPAGCFQIGDGAFLFFGWSPD